MPMYKRTIWIAHCDHCKKVAPMEETDSSYLDHRLFNIGWKRRKDSYYCSTYCYEEDYKKQGR